jgi:hypothetical protein
MLFSSSALPLFYRKRRTVPVPAEGHEVCLAHTEQGKVALLPKIRGGLSATRRGERKGEEVGGQMTRKKGTRRRRTRRTKDDEYKEKKDKENKEAEKNKEKGKEKNPWASLQQQI